MGRARHRGHRKNIGWGLALLLTACGDTLGPPMDPLPELPGLGPPPTPLSNRPSEQEFILPEEAAAKALAGFFQALDQGDLEGAATYLDEKGTSLVRDLRVQFEGGGGPAERAAGFLAGAEVEGLAELSETRVSGRLKLGPGGARTFGLELRQDRHGLWLVTRLHPLPVR